MLHLNKRLLALNSSEC